EKPSRFRAEGGLNERRGRHKNGTGPISLDLGASNAAPEAVRRRNEAFRMTDKLAPASGSKKAMRPGARSVFAVVSIFFLYEFVARIKPSLASGEIAEWFGLTNGGFGTLSSVFFLIYAPMQLVVGMVLDR
ncbi:hypothetical protein, partial [Heliomarina baculiformis]|uniref:hypothetical protein n=1 Tax=Heliomarina baculiformis TaxID=2872036 RepID=UPI001EE2FA02